MLGLKLNHVSKRGHWGLLLNNIEAKVKMNFGIKQHPLYIINFTKELTKLQIFSIIARLDYLLV